MKKTIALLTALMLVPTTTLASSIRNRVTHESLNSGTKTRVKSYTLCLGESEQITEKGEIVID